MLARSSGPWSRRLHTVGWAAMGTLTAVVVLRLCFAADLARQNVYLKVFVPAGRAFWHGLDLYAVDGGFRYPPVAAAWFAPFAAMGDRVGSIAWRLVLAFGLAAGVRAAFAADWPRALTAGERGLFLLLLTVAAAGSLNNGQPNLLILGCALLASVGFAQGRSTAPALCCAFATALKVYPVAHGLVLAALRPRLLLSLVPALAAALLLPFALQSWDYVEGQYQALIELLAYEDRSRNLADAYRDLRLLTAAVGVELPAALFQALQVTAGAAIAWSCWLLQRRGRSASCVADHAFGLVAGWYMLLGPATEKVTYVLLAPTLAWSWLRALAGARRGPRAFWSGVLLLFVLDHLLPGPSRAVQAAHPWTRCALPFAALLTAVALAARMRRELRCAVEPPTARG